MLLQDTGMYTREQADLMVAELSEGGVNDPTQDDLENAIREQDYEYASMVLTDAGMTEEEAESEIDRIESQQAQGKTKASKKVGKKKGKKKGAEKKAPKNGGKTSEPTSDCPGGKSTKHGEGGRFVSGEGECK